MKRFASIFLAFFALYALTAQRGMGWGDSFEFQDWALNGATFVCGPRFSNAHPLYVVFARLAGTSPAALLLGGDFTVTLVSSFFGALAVAGLYLITRKISLAVLFGLSQMLWWLSTVAEVQTMSLALTVFEVWCLKEAKNKDAWLYALALLCGVHLLVHNFVLLCLPVYLFAMRRNLRALALFAFAALPYVWFLVTRGPADVLFGYYAGKVVGVLPSSWTETGFNLALAAVSFVVPFLLFRWNRGNVAEKPILVLFAINFVFFIRYFVQDQAQFLLPTLFFAYVLLKDAEIGRNRAVSLAVMQIVLPIMAYFVVAQLPVPDYRRERHPDRDDAQYFVLPWHFNQNQEDCGCDS